MSIKQLIKSIVKNSALGPYVATLYAQCYPYIAKVKSFMRSHKVQYVLIRLMVRLKQFSLAHYIYQTIKKLPVIDKKALEAFYIKLLFDNGFWQQVEIAMAETDYKILKLVSVREWCTQNNVPIQIMGKIEDISILNPPTFSGEGYHAGEDTPIIIQSFEPYVAELSNVLIASKSSVIVTKDGFALNDVAAYQPYSSYVSLEYDKTIRARNGDAILNFNNYPTTIIEEGIFMSGLASEYFGHWVPEFLIKLKAYEHHPDFLKLPLIVDRKMPQSHFDYLQSIVKNRLIYLEEGINFECKRLLVAPTATFYPVELTPSHPIPQAEIGALSPEGLAWLREKVLAAYPCDENSITPCNQKIYLSRRNMSWRKVTNEAEIAAFVTAHGYQVVDIETLSFQDQIKLFRNAQSIIAPNGSSLLNLIFASQTTKLIVLSQSEIHNWGGYYGPFHTLGYDMVFLLGDKADVKHADYTIPLFRLEQALNMMKTGCPCHVINI